MRTLTRKVYYCEHCKRHRLTPQSILKHEHRCIYNPDRTACGWHSDKRPPGKDAERAARLKETGDIGVLRSEVDGCPACMLAAVVQADPKRELVWRYEDEVAEFRKDENRRDRW